MNFYGSYTTSRKKKTVRRVIAVTVSALIIFGATVVFGNYLKKKSGNSGVPNAGGIGRDEIFIETESSVIIPPSEGGAGSSESVQGACVMLGTAFDPKSEDDEAAPSEPLFSDIEKRISAAAEKNTGILIPLTGDDGYLLYNSPKASEISRLPANPALPDMAGLTSAVASSKEKGLRTTAYIRSSVSVSSADAENEIAIAADSRIAADAAAAGFDEIIVSSLVSTPEELTGERSEIILKYLNQMTAAAGNTRVGLSLTPEIYAEATLSPQIELFVSRSVFLAMEFAPENSTVEYLGYVCENLAGTLSVYNMRLMLCPADTGVADALVAKLKTVEHMNYLFTRVPSVKEVPPADPDVTE